MLLSLGLPGLGQLHLGQRRGWAYLALETVGWALWLDRRGAGAGLRDRYRDFAWDRGRIQAPARIDGGFAYYETLTQWLRSGAYDADALAPGVQPETDPTSYNGSIWARAAGIFLPDGPGAPGDPGYESAIAYYGEHAYGPELLWDWSGTGTAQDDFARLIERSDDRFRQATHVLGAVILNHAVAAVDAYLGARGVSSPVELRFVTDPVGPGGRWSGVARWALPR